MIEALIKILKEETAKTARPIQPATDLSKKRKFGEMMLPTQPPVAKP
jgi:hypothetical protein